MSVSAVQKGLPNSTWIFISFLGWFVSLIPLPSSTHDVPRNWGLLPSDLAAGFRPRPDRQELPLSFFLSSQPEMVAKFLCNSSWATSGNWLTDVVRVDWFTGQKKIGTWEWLAG